MAKVCIYWYGMHSILGFAVQPRRVIQALMRSCQVFLPSNSDSQLTMNTSNLFGIFLTTKEIIQDNSEMYVRYRDTLD